MKKLLMIGAALVFSLNLWAHGENKPGPHGGLIKMPGAFHTELVLEKDQLKIYLLDMNFKFPTVENSSIEVSVTTEKKDTPRSLKCQVDQDHFLCPLGELKKEEINLVEVKARRKKAQGIKVSYELSDPKGNSEKLKHNHSAH